MWTEMIMLVLLILGGLLAFKIGVDRKRQFIEGASWQKAVRRAVQLVCAIAFLLYLTLCVDVAPQGWQISLGIQGVLWMLYWLRRLTLRYLSGQARKRDVDSPDSHVDRLQEWLVNAIICCLLVLLTAFMLGQPLFFLVVDRLDSKLLMAVNWSRVMQLYVAALSSLCFLLLLQLKQILRQSDLPDQDHSAWQMKQLKQTLEQREDHPL